VSSTCLLRIRSAELHQVCKVVGEARAKEFSDVLFLDAATGKNIEEVASCNIFIVKGNLISTPALRSGTILAGVTRKSVIEIAVDLGYQVEERTIPVDDLLEADEVFCTGTAVVLQAVNSITYQGKRIEYKPKAEPAVSLKLHSILTGIQTGRIEDKKGWTVLLD
ncbi:Aminotransferase class IV, partial [Trema orientale]